VSRVSGIAHSAALQALLVSGKDTEAGEIIPLDGSQRRALPAGWRVLAVDRPGELLLMKRQGTLAVMSLTEKRPLPMVLPSAAPGEVYDAAWLERGVASTLLPPLTHSSSPWAEGSHSQRVPAASAEIV
jgi:hypothetical protein